MTLVKRRPVYTDDTHTKLKEYERNLTNAVKSSFVHMSGNDFQKIAEIYREVFGEALSRSQMNCNTCRLNALKRLGELYINYEKAEPVKKDTKRGRPKKLEEKEE